MMKRTGNEIVSKIESFCRRLRLIASNGRPGSRRNPLKLPAPKMLLECCNAAEIYAISHGPDERCLLGDMVFLIENRDMGNKNPSYKQEDQSTSELQNWCRMIVNEWYLYAFYGLAVSGASDWLDGFIARKMNINSVIGSYLDHLADKILIGCVAVAMVKKDLLRPGLVGLVVLRDVALITGAIFNRASSLGWKWKSWSNFVNLNDAHSKKVEPLLISKVNTVIQLILVASALLQHSQCTEEMELYVSHLR